MSKICSSSNFSALEELNVRLANAVLLFELSFECFLDSDRAGDDVRANTACALVYHSLDMLKTSVNNYRVFDDCLHSETDMNFYLHPESDQE